jgi:hypothetical protein
VRVCTDGRAGAYDMVRADVDPRDEVRLRHVLAVEELVKVLSGVQSERGAGEGKCGDTHDDGLVHVEHAARARLGLLEERDRKVVPRSACVVKKALRAHDRLPSRQRARPARQTRPRTFWIGVRACCTAYPHITPHALCAAWLTDRLQPYDVP